MTGLGGAPLKVCEANLSSFNLYGESLRIYFSFLKLFTYCFIVCGALGSFNSAINFRGFYLTDLQLKSPIDKITLANFYGFENYTTNSSAATWIEDA